MNGVLSSVFLTLGIVGIVLLVIFLHGKVLERKKHGQPAASQVLRRPGQSLQLEVDRLDESVQKCVVALVAGACLFLAGHLALTQFGKISESWERTLASTGGASLFMTYFLWRWLRLTARRRLFRLGLEGELAVGQALEELIGKGYQIYHDFPAETFNIDHIVIGSSGVMAVETKTRSGGQTRRGSGEAIVAYDGRMLHFPKNSDHQTIDRAKHQATWLSDWLSESMEDPISARAIVAIPGWHVKRTSADGIPVVNPKQFPTLFEHISPRPLSEGVVLRITQQIEQQYREALATSGGLTSN